MYSFSTMTVLLTNYDIPCGKMKSNIRLKNQVLNFHGFGKVLNSPILLNFGITGNLGSSFIPSERFCLRILHTPGHCSKVRSNCLPTDHLVRYKSITRYPPRLKNSNQPPCNEFSNSRAGQTVANNHACCLDTNHG